MSGILHAPRDNRWICACCRTALPIIIDAVAWLQAQLAVKLVELESGKARDLKSRGASRWQRLSFRHHSRLSGENTPCTYSERPERINSRTACGSSARLIGSRSIPCTGGQCYDRHLEARCSHLEKYRLLGVEPYITVNAGFGDAWSARELGEYTNGAPTTPMGKWRAQNGPFEPYHVKFWNVGNEPWGDYQMGAMSLPQFELKHNLFVKEMKKVDSSIKLIVGGAMPDVMEGADQARRINGQYVPDYLTAADWTGQMLLNCLDNIDMVSEHYYASGTQHTDMKLQKKVPMDPPLSPVEWERAPAVQVRAKYEHYQEYLKRIPALRAKSVPITIDEWAYFGGNWDSYKVVPTYAWAFHEMFRHSDVFQMGAFTFATAMMSSNRTEATLNPTGMLFKMYRDHFGTISVKVSGDSPQPKPTFPAGGDQPAVNPGSETYPLDVSAALSEDHKTLAIAVLNPSDSEQSITIAINGAKLASTGKLWRMAPDSIDATVAGGQEARSSSRRTGAWATA